MSLKKTLVALMVMAMLLTSAVTASAGSAFPDVEGTKYADAASRLAALNILKGFEDGSFKPNDAITRAQFAAVAVRTLGLASAADYAKVDTKFTDVPGSHWAAGFINVAVDQGLLRGYPDGTFKPESQVTYAEALAIVVRALGYEPSIKGAWPTNYIVKGAEIGISKGMTFAANAPAPRGDVALFVDNSLEIPLMIPSVVSGVGTTYVVSGTNNTDEQTILKDKLDLDLIQKDSNGVGAEVKATPSYAFDTLKSNEIKIDNSEYEVVGAQDIDSFLGLQVKAYVKENKVYGLVSDTESGNIVSDLVDEVDLANNKITLENGNEYSFIASPLVYISGKASQNTLNADLTTINSDLNAGKPVKVKLVLVDGGTDSGKVKFMLVSRAGSTNLVTSVDTSRKLVKYETTAGASSKDLDDDYDAYRVIKDGKVADVADIKAGDLISITEFDSNVVVRVSSKKVSGKLTAVEAADTFSDYKVTIGDTTYEVSGIPTISTDDGDTIANLNAAAIQELLGEDVTAYLDGFGQAQLIVGDATGDAEIIGVVSNNTDNPPGYKDFLEIVKSDGTKVAYEFVDQDARDTLTAQVGDVVEVTPNSDGKLDDNDVTVKIPLAGAGANTITAFDDDNDSFTAGSRYFVTADTQIFKAYDGDGDGTIEAGELDPSAVKWDVLKKFDLSAAVDPDVKVQLKTGTNVAEYVLITNDVTISGSGDVAIVVSRGLNADGDTITLNFKGTATTYNLSLGTVNASVYENGYDDTSVFPNASMALVDIDPDDIVTFQKNASGEITSITELNVGDPGHTHGTIGNLDATSKVITVGAKSYKVTSDTAIYDTKGSKLNIEFGDLGEGDHVMVFDTDNDGVAEVVKILD